MFACATGGVTAQTMQHDSPVQTAAAVDGDDNCSDDFPENEEGSSGDVPIEIAMDNGTTVTVTFGEYEEGQFIRFDATVRDTDGDGEAVLYFNTTAFDGPDDGFVAGEGTEVIATDSRYVDGLPNIATGVYDVFASAGETPWYESAPADTATVRLRESPTAGSTYESVSVEVPENPRFDITGTDLGSTSVSVDERVRVDATVNNTGSVAESFNVTLQTENEELETDTVSLGADNETVVTFEHSFADAGSYELAVENVGIGTVTVEADTGGRSETNDSDTDESDDGTGPGFGMGIALASLSGVAYLLTRRGEKSG